MKAKKLKKLTKLDKPDKEAKHEDPASNVSTVGRGDRENPVMTTAHFLEALISITSSLSLDSTHGFPCEPTNAWQTVVHQHLRDLVVTREITSAVAMRQRLQKRDCQTIIAEFKDVLKTRFDIFASLYIVPPPPDDPHHRGCQAEESREPEEPDSFSVEGSAEPHTPARPHSPKPQPIPYPIPYPSIPGTLNKQAIEFFMLKHGLYDDDLSFCQALHAMSLDWRECVLPYTKPLEVFYAMDLQAFVLFLARIAVVKYKGPQPGVPGKEKAAMEFFPPPASSIPVTVATCLEKLVLEVLNVNPAITEQEKHKLSYGL